MKLYSCWCRHKGGTTMQLPLPKVTAAEIVLLRRIHGDDAVIKIKHIGNRQVTDAAEFARLAEKYKMARENDQALVEICFPGASPILPQEITMPQRTTQQRMVEDTQTMRPDELEAKDEMLKGAVPLDPDEDDDGDELPPAEFDETEDEIMPVPEDINDANEASLQ